MWDAWRTAAAELETLTTEQDARVREAEDLRAAIADIEAVDPQSGEDTELAQRAERLANAEELRLAAATAHAALSNEEDLPDVQGLLAEARRALERAAGSDEALRAHAAVIEELGYRVADVAGELSGYLADLDEGGPHELAAVEERRAALNGLVRVHGSLDAALELLASGSARLAELDDDGDRIDRLTAERDRLRDELDARATELTDARRAAASRLGEAVTDELRHLALPDATVTVAVEPGPEAAHGRDVVTIQLAPHRARRPAPSRAARPAAN